MKNLGALPQWQFGEGGSSVSIQNSKGNSVTLRWADSGRLVLPGEIKPGVSVSISDDGRVWIGSGKSTGGTPGLTRRERRKANAMRRGK